MAEKKAADKAVSEKKGAKAKLKSANKLSAATEKVKVKPMNKGFVEKIYPKIGSAASLKKATLLGLIQPKKAKTTVLSEKNKDTKSSKSVKSQSKEKDAKSKLIPF
jgi:hypothetical protein